MIHLGKSLFRTALRVKQLNPNKIGYYFSDQLAQQSELQLFDGIQSISDYLDTDPTNAPAKSNSLMTSHFPYSQIRGIKTEYFTLQSSSIRIHCSERLQPSSGNFSTQFFAIYWLNLK